ncbi:MAG: class I SAM-dependent methyltransferase [Bacteroidales bacterium]
MKEIWDERYSSEEYVYGEEPNDYLKEKLSELQIGTILFPAEGEGRNAVYSARNGWKVSAFDISKEGQKKALRLADKHQVKIDYQVGSIEALHYSDEQFDVAALIYAHFPAEIKSAIHHTLNKYIRKGGYIIFEAFSKQHIEYQKVNERAGGPKDFRMLFSIAEIKSDFVDYDIIELSEKEIELKEGLFHIGKASVIRFFGRKK